MSSIDELVEASITAATAEPMWLGSEDHLRLLSESLEGLGADADITVGWAPPGTPGFWEAVNCLIRVERPTPGPADETPEYRARYTAIGLLHESTHSRFSSPSSMPRRKMTLPPGWVRNMTEAMFNYLEDARISELAVAESPELAEPIGMHLDAALDKIAQSPYFNGPGTTPKNPRAQLPFAIIAYTLRPERDIELHPAVNSELETLKPIIDAARAADRTDACVSPAVQLTERVIHFQRRPGAQEPTA